MMTTSLILSALASVPVADASTGSIFITCKNLVSHKERISHNGNCKVGKEAQATWHESISDSKQEDSAGLKTISICKNKPSSKFKYQLIRNKCLSSQIQVIYYRQSGIPQTPNISKISADGHDSARITLTESFNGNIDAPTAYYTISSNKGGTSTISVLRNLDLFVTIFSSLLS